MKKIKHTDRIKDCERKYWDAFHYWQTAKADPGASWRDMNDTLEDCKAAYEELCRAIWTQHKKQHGETVPIATIRVHVTEWIRDNQNIMSSRTRKA